MKKLTIKIVMALLCPINGDLIQRKKIFLAVLMAIIVYQPASGQHASVWVSGRVISNEGNKPLPGATVQSLILNVKAGTDKDGRFRTQSNDSTGTLKISFVGYKTVLVNYDGANINDLFVTLIRESNELNEVVVSTGYQTLPKERATGSFDVIDNQLVDRRTSTDLLSRLDGVASSVLFNRNTENGQAGQSDISIRGVSTLFANNQPLIVVDGFPYNGDLDNLNPNDVQSITILKDAAASSIWGTRSGNGVIVVTTKKGKKNQALSVDFNSNVTISNKPNLFYNPNFLPSSTFIDIEEQLYKAGAYSGDLSSVYRAVSPVVQLLANESAGLISDADATAQINALRNIDVRDDLTKYFYQHAVSQQYSLGLKGGGDKSDYYFSLGEDHDLAPQVGNQNNRLTLSSNYNFNPVKNLSLIVAYNLIQTDGLQNSPVSGIITTSKGSIYPYAQLVNSNGNGLPIVHDYSLNYINTAGAGKFLDWNYNPLQELESADNTTKSIDNRLNLGLSYKFLKYFNIDIKYEYEYATSNLNDNYDLSTYYTRNLINTYSNIDPSENLITPIPVGGILQQSEAVLNAQQGRAQLNFSNSWNAKDEINAIAGYEISQTINQTSANTLYGYDSGSETNNPNLNFESNFPTNPSGSATIPTTESLGKTTNNFISYFSNAAYTYDEKYTFSLSGRIDKSNLFGVATNQKAIPLFSSGLAWSINKESFYHVEWLPQLKLRATYGYTGNINTSATAVTTLRQAASNFNPYPNGNPYDFVASPGNPDLRWEKDRMINLGIDFGTKNQIVSGSFEYYQKKGSDLFGNSPLAPSTGLTTYFGNTADTKGHGFDLVINTRNIQTTNFLWTTNFLLSHVQDVVTQYNAQISSSSFIQLSNASTISPLAGKAIYSIYSYRWGGLTHDTGDPQGYLNGKLSTDYADIINQTTLNDMVYSGSARPASFGSFRNNFACKNLTLSVNISYELGFYFRRNSYESSSLPWAGNIDYFKRWQKPGDEAFTNIPSFQLPPYTTDRDEFYQYSSVLIDKGDNIRLKDIRLSYDFDKSTIEGLPFTHLSIYAYASNLAILWRANKDHLDPDVVVGSPLYSYPQPTTYAIGIKANF